MQLDVYDIMIKTLVNMWDALKANPVLIVFIVAACIIAFLKAIKSPVSRKEKGAYGEKHIFKNYGMKRSISYDCDSMTDRYQLLRS